MFLMLDFETRSRLTLKRASYRKYARDVSTGILCLGIKRHGKPGRTMTPSRGSVFSRYDRCPSEIVEAINTGLPIYAHNAVFDRTIYQDICVELLGWPAIPFGQWHDTMAVCAYYALPRKLAKAGEALQLRMQKDAEGSRVLSQVTKPRRPGKKAVRDWLATGRTIEEMPLIWWEEPDKLLRVYAYCCRDVESQAELLTRLGPLPLDRLRDWRLDQLIGERGLPVDWASLITASQVVDESLYEYNQRLRVLTATPSEPEGMVQSVNQRDKILNWCDLMGYFVPSLDKATVEHTLAQDDLPPMVREVLTIRQEAGKSSLGKLETMLDQTDLDGRVRNTLVWHGAATGRMAGRGIQPQNFPRKTLSAKIRKNTIDEQFGMSQVDRFHHYLAHRQLAPDLIAEDSVPEVISAALRSFIMAEPGKRLFISDFSNIETRNVAWLSGCRLLLQAFNNGECPYKQFAGRVYRRDPDSIAKDSQERQLGKVAVLGLGYQMGPPKFVTTAAGPGYNVILTEERASEVVKLYRSTYYEIPRMWDMCEKAMATSILTGQSVTVNGKVTFGANKQWAWIILPSGRPIWFKEPLARQVPDRFRPGRMRTEITYMGKDPKNNTNQWKRRPTYGGSILESISQGMAADLLTEACHRLEAIGYPVILTVHDEVVSENDESAPLEPFHQTVKVVPHWCPGMPVECESHVSVRYGK